MTETQRQRLNVRVSFTKLVRNLCYTCHLGIQCNIDGGWATGFVVFSFPSLNSCKAFSECEPATNRIDGLGLLFLLSGKSNFASVEYAGRPSL